MHNGEIAPGTNNNRSMKSYCCVPPSDEMALTFFLVALIPMLAFHLLTMLSK